MDVKLPQGNHPPGPVTIVGPGRTTLVLTAPEFRALHPSEYCRDHVIRGCLECEKGGAYVNEKVACQGCGVPITRGRWCWRCRTEGIVAKRRR